MTTNQPGQQELWRTTLASIGDAVIATDTEGRVTFLNPVAEQLTGWPLSDAKGMPLTDVFRIVNETTRRPVENPALRALRTGLIVGLANHTILIARDGTERPIDDSAAPIRNEAGAVSGAVLVFRDITERRKAEEVQARLAAIVASSGDAIVSKTLDGVIRSWNAGAEQVFGYTAAEAIGRPIAIIIPPERLDEERGIIDRLRRGESIDHFETVRVRKDGRRVDISLTVSPIRDSEGQVIGASKVARDISGRKQAEEALKESEARHRLLADLADATQPLTDPGEIMTTAARLLAEHLGADRCAYAEVEDESLYVITGDYMRGLPSIVGRWPIGAFGAEHLRVMRANEPYVVEDTDADPRVSPDDLPAYRATDIRAVICVPLQKGGRLTAAMAVHQKVPRIWTPAEVRLVKAVAARCWEALERAAAERALAASRSRLDYAVQASGLGFWYCDLPFDELQWDERVMEHFWLPPDARVTIDTFYDQIHPDDREPTRAAIGRSIAERTGYDIHYRTVAPGTGAEKWIRAIGGTYYDESGAPKRFDGVTLDVTDQRRAEGAVRESSDRFAMVARATNDAVWDWDMRTDAVWWNEGVTALFGYRREDVGPDATWWYGHIHPEDQKRVVDGIHAVIDHGGARWSAEYRFLKADGTYATILDRGYAIHEGGKTIRLVGAMQDVTGQRRAEEQLREGERKYRTLFESIDEGFCVVEVLFEGGRAADYRFLVVNPMFERQTGLRDAVGRRMREFAPDHEEFWLETYGRVALTGEPVRFQDYAQALGRYFDVYAFRTGPPEARNVAMLFRDVTARKRAEESMQFLADASASLAELVDYQSTLNRIANLALSDFADWCVVDMIGEDGKRERLAVTATEPEDVTVSRRVDTTFKPIDGATGLVPHVLRTGEPEVVFDLAEIDPLTAPQGPERLERLRGIGIRSYLCVPLLSRGQVIGGMTFLSTSARRRFGPEELRVAQNLSERVTVAIENARLYRTLQDQDRRKDEFLATLAHELRNPLAPIRNGLQILRIKETDAESVETLSMMDRQLRHVTHLVDDLMDVARVSSGKVKLRLERVPLRAILDAAVETSRQAIEAAGHELALKMPREPLTVEADKTRMVQVLANLLNNAAKYTAPDGRITLSVGRDREYALIRVADTGLGIPHEMLPKVFEMFTQVGTSLERSQGGLGIGLTLVKRLVEMHGGTVVAESPGHGQGSTFTVRVPLAAEAVPAVWTSPAETNGATGDPLDILVVDDNRDSATSLARLLKIKGHRVKAAYDGPEALRLLANYRPQLILLDLGLPGMSGYEVAQRIRASTELRGVVLAALTGWGQEEDRRRTREGGFDHHLVKPADTDELDGIVRGIKAKP